MNATEYRALGRLMRHARAEGYTYRRTTMFGRTDWSWSKGGECVVSAKSLWEGWLVLVGEGRAQLFPESVQQLTDVLVSLGLLPAEFSSVFAGGKDEVEAEKVRPLRAQLNDIKDVVGWFEPGDEPRALKLRDDVWHLVERARA